MAEASDRIYVCVYMSHTRAHTESGLGRCSRACHILGAAGSSLPVAPRSPPFAESLGSSLPSPRPSVLSCTPLTETAGCGSKTGVGWTMTALVGERFTLPVGGFPGRGPRRFWMGCGKPEGADVGQERQARTKPRTCSRSLWAKVSEAVASER